LNTIFLFLLFLISIITKFIFSNFISFITINGNSMFPTLKHKDKILVKKSKTYNPNDLIVIKLDHILIIKRIIGISGDQIALKHNLVYKNNILLSEPYIYSQKTLGLNSYKTIDENCYFVMGDNRNYSLDSRDKTIGQIHVSQIIGKVFFKI